MNHVALARPTAGAMLVALVLMPPVLRAQAPTSSRAPAEARPAQDPPSRERFGAASP